MKKLLIIFILMLSIKGFSQDSYFLGKTNYCTPEKADSKQIFEGAITALNFPKLYLPTTMALLKTAKEDPKYCDVFFLAGYYARLQNLHKEALVLYYAADSLAQNKASIFKQNLAIQFMRFGKVDKAREKYEEMVKYFPDNPEGYYGIGNTSIVIGDYDKGLENLKQAEEIYKKSGKVKDDVIYMYGMLYAMKEDYEAGLPYLENAYSTYKNDEGYLSLYSLSLIKIGKSRNDEKMIKKANKMYNKIKNKEGVPDIKKKLAAEFS
ncbi:tetratricopeptide repeat protein [Chryseobacterium takakiae]|uniref:Tetratricopeptide repeat-containing protein n=1 Tax=Chryseobacterium takakiae TaxID=1302685 RepID=A0A1M4SUT1_9FLAO|nr:tetratricopeptide repeat protein [Chryseobacterium takakiae]SHE35918.1 Tetratricopeptide repeat-containing protein [Chryseobacterium takakiae]